MSKLRELIEREQILLAPGGYDVLTAKLVEQAGAEAFYLSGSGVATSCLGAPDVGLISLPEMVTRISKIANAITIPIIADGDTGYGNPINVMRTVREYEKAGASAIQLEDQVFPKKCGHFEGKKTIGKNEMVQKIKAGIEARESEDFLIIARTDARATHGLDEAIERGIAYGESGADIIFVEAPETIQEMERITEEIDVPLMANMVEGGKTPLLPAQKLEDIGFAVVIWANTALRAGVKKMQDMLNHLLKHGTSEPRVDELLSFEERNEVTGLAEIQELERRFSA